MFKLFASEEPIYNQILCCEQELSINNPLQELPDFKGVFSSASCILDMTYLNLVQTLRVVIVGGLACSLGTTCGSAPSLTATLSPKSGTATSWGSRGARSRRSGSRARSAEFALNEVERGLTVYSSISLVRILVVTGAAVRVGGVAV